MRVFGLAAGSRMKVGERKVGATPVTLERSGRLACVSWTRSLGPPDCRQCANSDWQTQRVVARSLVALAAASWRQRARTGGRVAGMRSSRAAAPSNARTNDSNPARWTQATLALDSARHSAPSLHSNRVRTPIVVACCCWCFNEETAPSSLPTNRMVPLMPIKFIASQTATDQRRASVQFARSIQESRGNRVSRESMRSKPHSQQTDPQSIARPIASPRVENSMIAAKLQLFNCKCRRK